MKAIPVVFALIIIGCTAPPPVETAIKQDTASVTLVSSDSVTPVLSNETGEIAPILMPDSISQALRDLVTAQFEDMETMLADSGNYYKVHMVDYYDEYEGQDEITYVTWFFDKEFSPVYAIRSYQNGAMEKPDVKEYVLKDNAFVCIKEEASYNEVVDGRSFIFWNVLTGGIKVNYSTYDSSIVSKEAIPRDYETMNKNEWDVNMNLLSSMLEKADNPPGYGDVYTILIEEPKPSELVDYTRVVIPKEAFYKLLPVRE